MLPDHREKIRQLENWGYDKIEFRPKLPDDNRTDELRDHHEKCRKDQNSCDLCAPLYEWTDADNKRYTEIDRNDDDTSIQRINDINYEFLREYQKHDYRRGRFPSREGYYSDSNKFSPYYVDPDDPNAVERHKGYDCDCDDTDMNINCPSCSMIKEIDNDPKYKGLCITNIEKCQIASIMLDYPLQTKHILYDPDYVFTKRPPKFFQRCIDIDIEDFLKEIGKPLQQSKLILVEENFYLNKL